MLCDDCKKNEAVVFMTQICGKSKTEKHLCEECAKKYGEMLLGGEGFSVNDFLAGIFNQGQDEHELQKALAQTADKCPNCGMSYRDFARTGKIGCSECYTAFHKILQPLLRRIHGSSLHIGKIPKRTGSEIAIKQKINRLRKDLQRCIDKEEYEQAAKHRDEIKRLEQEFKAECGREAE